MEAPARGASSPAKDDQALGWDDEELETSIFDKPVGADTPEARANGGFLGPDDKTVAVPLSEATLAEMNEGFPAPSTFSDKVPTHKENQPAPLRQTVMGMGQTPPVRPLPLPPPTGRRRPPNRPATRTTSRATTGNGTPGAARPQVPAPLGGRCLHPWRLRLRPRRLVRRRYARRCWAWAHSTRPFPGVPRRPCQCRRRFFHRRRCQGSTRGRRAIPRLACPASPMACRGHACRRHGRRNGGCGRLVPAAAVTDQVLSAFPCVYGAWAVAEPIST